MFEVGGNNKVGIKSKLTFRTTESEPPPIVNFYAFDTYGQGLDGIAFHKLTESYSGNLLILQRLVDNAIETFKFGANQYWISEDSPNATETTTIGDWTAGSDFVIVTHINQGTKGNYTQSAAGNRPYFGVNGAILRDAEGYPYADCYYGGIIRFLQQSPHVNVSQPMTAYSVCTTGATLGSSNFLWLGNGVGNQKLVNKGGNDLHNTNWNAQVNDNNLLSANQKFVAYSMPNNTLTQVATDNNPVQTGTAGTNTLNRAPNIGAHSAALFPWTGRYQECLLWSGDQSANNVDIRAELVNLYEI